MSERLLIVCAAINMIIAVGAGAFGAHGLRNSLTPDMLTVWHTAVTYQVMHGIGLFILALLWPRLGAAMGTAGWLMLGGIVLFCGSLYVLALGGVRVLGAITPIGGVAFIAAWAVVAWAGWRHAAAS